jgi:hypothetical protein
MLHRLSATPSNLFHVIDTQGTLSAADWANELHPFPAGFAKIAQLFSDALSRHVRPADMVAALAASAEAPPASLLASTTTPDKEPAKKRAAPRAKAAAAKRGASRTGRRRKT